MVVRCWVAKLPRCPFGLREKVDEKLDELLRLDIVKEVLEELAGWISPLVVGPKVTVT